MPLPKLVPGQGPAPFDVQDTAFTYDVLGRYVCNTWEVPRSTFHGMGPWSIKYVNPADDPRNKPKD
jgi:hypothetical protein